MVHEPFSVAVNGQYEFSVNPEDAQTLDILKSDNGAFHILKNGISYHAELVEARPSEHTYVFRIAGNRYEVKIADRYERLIKQLGLSVGGTQKINSIKAPMPGLVLNILVEAGQTVQKGDPLVILEAMKMENVIKAAGDAVVKAVKVQKGTAVDKGQLLLELE